MTDALDKLKSSARSAAYTSAGIPLLIGDAIAGRKVPTPGFASDGAAAAREQAGAALAGLRRRTGPPSGGLIAKLPDPLAEALSSGSRAVWKRLGIDEPAADAEDATDAQADREPAEAEPAEPVAGGAEPAEADAAETGAAADDSEAASRADDTGTDTADTDTAAAESAEEVKASGGDGV